MSNFLEKVKQRIVLNGKTPPGVAFTQIVVDASDRAEAKAGVAAGEAATETAWLMEEARDACRAKLVNACFKLAGDTLTIRSSASDPSSATSDCKELEEGDEM